MTSGEIAGPSVKDVQRVASFRVAIRAFQRGTERARAAPA